jgi:hypothetical protein
VESVATTCATFMTVLLAGLAVLASLGLVLPQ